MNIFDDNFLESLYLGLIILDQELNIVFQNSWILDHTHQKNERVNPLPFFDIFPNAKDSSVEKSIRNTLTTGMSNLLSNRLNQENIRFYRNKYSDEVIPIRIVITPYHKHDNKYALMQVFDMSQVHDREQFLIKQTKVLDEERAKSSNAARLASIGEMAGGIAHEINNPLTIIQAATDKLYRFIEAEPLNKESVIKKLDLINKTTKRIAKIVTGIRSISRSPSDEDFEIITLQEVIEDVLSIFSERFISSGIELKIDLKDNSFQSKFCALKLLFYQVFINLLNNSYDAIIDMENERWVSIEAKEVGDKIQILYTDSGNGIDPEVGKNIFVPFYTTKDVGKGTGLGMSTVYKIIMAHHGEIYIDHSHPNTRFVITLPKKQSK